jgi:hypothetical protein
VDFACARRRCNGMSCGRRQDTVIGFLLAGVGHRDAKDKNWLIVDGSACAGARLGRARLCGIARG